MAIRIVYMSTPKFGVPTLRMLVEDPRCELVGVITPPDKPAGRGLKLTPPPVAVVARELRPDVGAVAAYRQWTPMISCGANRVSSTAG